jgi:hypothetical protein
MFVGLRKVEKPGGYSTISQGLLHPDWQVLGSWEEASLGSWSFLLSAALEREGM